MIWAVALIAGLVGVAVGGVLACACPTFTVGLGVQAIGAGLLAAAGLGTLLTGSEFGASFTSGFEPRFGVDGLSGFFLAVLGVVGACALLFASRSLAVTGTGPCDRRADWRVRARAGACARGA